MKKRTWDSKVKARIVLEGLSGKPIGGICSQVQPVNKRWKGLVDNDSWQNGYLKAGSLAFREILFWVGE
jgi:hypothetical protein